MVPTLQPGDWLIALRTMRIRRGDVVVVRHPARAFDVVKRVVALPEERFNGLELGPDEYLVLGDNIAGSTDGRAFGPVKRRAINGVVRFRYWPRPRPIGSR
jgi:signal peptidase I